jgi:hypothetical protein
VTTKPDIPQKKFRITKWFLDFLGPDGSILIVYAACLEWRGGVIPYTNVIWHKPDKGITRKSSFSKGSLPKREEGRITWADRRFGIEAAWEAKSEPVHARLYESGNQILDWQCWQPHSRVTLKKDNMTLSGEGYAEVISTSFSAWEIPMRELRWGHMFSEGDWAVWIELNGDTPRQWVWWNGQRTEGCRISDSEVFLPGRGITLKLDQALVLEKEQKVNRVVRKLVGYIPGFSKIIPMPFLMANQTMWESTIDLKKDEGGSFAKGRAVHEFLDLKFDSDGTQG